ncbi:hypothetical protein BLNAU_19674 [Blattamonas nauphoetae]|uniref:Protein kinase domain-containing protein n=1 Tax=Blattamonas nauphoetae TaxID=2049346 RepID=A0ABQ9X133_9EUKA|nr:hypothetical protein BLNAU_19674 [Blattamonas nauphoetae]
MQIEQIHGHTATIDGSSSFVTVHCTICLHNDEAALLVSGTSQMIHTDIVITKPLRTAPLVFSGCGSGSFQVHELTLSDLVVAERMSLLGNSLSSLSLSNTVFRNVSNFDASPTILDDTSMQTTQVSGCKLDFVENGLYGTIFGNINGAGTFLGMNMTILSNDATYQTSYVNQAGKVYSSSTSLESVYFENCTSANSGGGLYFGGNGAFSLKTSKFVNCKVISGNHGGGFSFSSFSNTGQASLFVSDCIIIGCYAGHVGGGLHIGTYNQNNPQVTTTLENITLQTSEAASGTGGLLLQFLSDTTVNNVQIENCRAPYRNSMSLEGAKGVHTLTSFKILSTQESTSDLVWFSFCYKQIQLSSWHVASLGHLTTDILKYPLPTISDLFVERGNSSNELPSLIFQEQYNSHFQAAGFTPSTLFTTDSFTTANQPAVIANGEQSGWMKGAQINVNSEEGVEDFFCWVRNSKCKSLRDVLPRTGSQFDGSIRMDEGRFEEHDLKIGGRRLGMSGTTQEGTIVKDCGSTTALMTVTTGQLTLSTLTLSPSGSRPLISSGGSVIISFISISPLSTSSASLITSKGGSVTASHLEVASIAFSAGHVFSIANADLVLSNCRFSSIKGASDGSVFSSTGSGKISLETVSFSDCSCDDVNAGSVIHITRPSFVENQIVLEGVTIASPSSTHKYQVFISCPSGAGHVKGSWWSFVAAVPTTPVLLRNEFWCEDSSDSSKSSCMAYHVYPFASGAVHVSDGCEDHALCGSVDAPCVSMSAGMNQMKETKRVTLKNPSSLDVVLTSLDSAWTLTQASGAGLTVSQAGSFSVASSNAHLTLSSLLISLGTVTTNSLVSVSAGALIMEACTIGDGITPMPITLGSVVGGILTLSGANTLKLVSSSSPLFVVSSGSLSIGSATSLTHPSTARTSALISLSSGSVSFSGDALDFSSKVTLPSSSVIEQTGGVLAVSESTVGNVSKTSGNGGVLMASLTKSTDSLSMTSTTFSHCSAGGSGGVLFVSCGSGVASSQLVVRVTSFETCSSGSGKGGCVFVSGSGLASLIAPANWSGHPTSLGETESLFWGEDLALSSTPFSSATLLVYLVAFSHPDISLASDGQDVVGCGRSDLPCGTLEHSLTHLSTHSTNIVTISGSTILDFELKTTLLLLELSGKGETKQNVKVEDGGLITASGNSLALTNLHFSTALTSSLSLISLSSSGSLTITSCSFSSFTCSSNGSIVCGSVGSTQTLKLSDVRFEDCWSSVGAHSVHLDLSACTSTTPLLFKSLAFTHSTGTLSPDVLIVGRDLGGIVSRSVWEGTLESSAATQLWSEDTKHNIACSLLVYLRDIESEIQVRGSQHADFDDCGHFGVGCSSLGKGIGRMNCGVSTTTLTIASDLRFDELISFVSEKEAILTRSAGVAFSRGQNGRFWLKGGKVVTQSIAFTTVEAEFSESFFTLTSSGSLWIRNSSFVGFKSSCAGSIVCGTVGAGQSLSIDGSSSFSSCSGGDGGCMSVSVVGSGSIGLGGSFSKCSSSGKGGALNLDLTGMTELGQISFDSLLFSTTDGNSALEGSNMFVTSSSLSKLATSEPFVSLAPAAQTALFDDSEKNSFVGFESSEVQGSLLYFWHPHVTTSGSVHVHSSGVDHVNCGLSSLPCSSLRRSMAAMKDSKSVTLDSSMDVSGLFESTASEWTLTQSSTSHILSLTENGQLKISSDSGSKLTLVSLHIVSKELTADRTSPLIEVGSGSLRFSSCSIGESGRTIPLTLCSVDGGSVSFEGDTTIVNPSASHHLLRVVSGELSIDSSLTITHSLSPRTVSLIAMTGGTTTIKDSIASIVSSPPPLTVGGTANLVLDSVTDAFSRNLPTIVDQIGGSVTMISCSFSDGSLTDSFIASSGSMKIVDTRFAELRAKSSSNGMEKRALTLTVNENECVVIGDENDAVEFVDCSSDGDGGAMHCRVNVGGELSLLNVSFSGCSSSGVGGGLAVVASEKVLGSSLTIRASFASCSCGSGGKGDWMHLTGWSFEDLIVLSNWEVSESSLSSPSDDSLLFGVDLAEEPSSSYKEVTLLYYLIGYRGATIFVGSEGRDAAGCGQYVWRCRSLEQGVSHLEGHETLKLVVVSGTVLSDAAVFGKNNVEVVSESEIERITVIAGGQLLLKNAASPHKIGVTSVLFALGEQSDLPLIVSNCGHVNITSCSFEWTGDLPRPLVSIAAGKFTLSNLELANAHFSITPFVVASSDALVVSGVSLSDCVGDVLLSVSNTKSVKMSSCQFDGVLPEVERNSESLCSWSTGLIGLEDCETVRMDNVQFYEQRQGGLFVSNSNVTLHSCLFEHNSAGSSRFPSANRNIRCEGDGRITIPSVGMSNVEEVGSQWISTDSCVLSGAGANVDSPLFVAAMTNKSWSVFHVKNKTMDVCIVGRVLIACGLRLGVFEWDLKNGKETGMMMELDLSEMKTSKWEEESIVVTLNQKVDLWKLDTGMEWRGRLLFGPSGRSSEWMVIRESDGAIRKSLASKNMPWILGIVGGVLLMLLAVIIIIVLVRRCKKEKGKDEKKPMMAEMDVFLDEMKVEDQQTWPGQMNTSTDNILGLIEDRDGRFGLKHIDTANNEIADGIRIPDDEEGGVGMMVEAVRCEGEFESVVTCKSHTLYSRLHGKDQGKKLDAKTTAVLIVQGLQNSVTDKARREMFLRLAPNWILLDEKDGVLLQMRELGKSGEPTEQGNTTANRFLESGQSRQSSGVRWASPEVVAGQSFVNVNHEKASVFSLGLILWEMETGQVPLREIDGVNAQRQLATGTGLVMTNIVEWKKELIEKCLSVEADSRPTLKEIEQTLKTSGKTLDTIDEKQEISPQIIPPQNGHNPTG